MRRLPGSGSTMQHWVRKVSVLSAGTIAKVSVPRMRVRMMNQGAGPLKPMALNSRLLRRTGASGELVSWMYMSVYCFMDLMLNIVISLSKFLKNLHILSIQLQLAGVDYFLAVDDGGEVFQEAAV